MMETFAILDFETYSEADLKLVGAWEYAFHPSTEIVCAAWRVGNRETLADGFLETQTWCKALKIGSKSHLSAVINDPSIKLIAHNAGFDRLIASRFFNDGELIELSRWICSASLAATHALPRNLEGACQVLELEHQKNPDGKKLIRRFSMPRKPTKKNPDTRDRDPEGLAKFLKYCADDVNATTELFLTLPPLNKTERKVWKMNQRINTRGVYVDRTLAKTALKMIGEETRRLQNEVQLLTDGRLTSAAQTKKLKVVLAEWGLVLPNLQKKTIEDALQAGLARGKTKQLLLARQAASKTSTGKYIALLQRSNSDSRVRDLQLYHGASTGREAGMGFQPHNLVKPTIESIEIGLEALSTGDAEWVRAIAGEPMEVIASCIRSTLTATPGYTIFSADFNAIEARTVLWLAGDAPGLKLFASGGDPYVAEAGKIYQKSAELITSAQRDVGKAVILGSGFGMGADKFFLTCKQKGMPVTQELAKHAIATYRKEHAAVPKLWSNLERAAIFAVRNPGKSVRVNKTLWFVRGKFLYCQLPSGRRLAFFGPSIRNVTTSWGDQRPALYRWYQDNYTRQWVNGGTYGGELTENVTQAVARDLMMEAQLRVEAAGYRSLFTVHDEINTERKTGTGTLEEYERLMSTLPEWATGLPVKVKGWTGTRYKK